MNINELIEQIGGRKRLEKIASWSDVYGQDSNVMLPASEAEAMARAMLSMLDAKPVGYITPKCLKLMERDRINADFKYHVISGIPYPAKSKKISHVALYTTPPAASVPDGLVTAVNILLDSDGSRGTFSAIRRGNALAEVERLLAAAPAPGGE